MNSLSLFTNVRSSNDVRLQVVENDYKYIQVAAEKLGSRVVSWFGKWPVFQSVNAVKSHVENIKSQDKIAIQAFTSALSEKYSENTIKSAMTSLGFDVSEKPLTKRTIDKIVGSANVIDANEKLVSQLLLDAMSKGMPKNIEDIKQLTGASLKHDFKSLSTESGALRSLRTFTAGLSKIPEAKELAKYVQTLNNIEVGRIPFSNWGTSEGDAQKFVERANAQELDLAANKIKAIALDIGKLMPMIELLQKNISVPLPLCSGPGLGLGRFGGKDVSVNPYTQVLLKDGTPLPVNVLSCDGKEVALAGSYPKDSPLALEAHMKMLLEKECSCLVVLTPESQMKQKELPAYFTECRKGYTGLAYSSTLNTDKSNPGRYDVYDLHIYNQGQKHSLPVVHIKNWIDHQALESHEELASLAFTVMSLQNKNVYENAAPGTHLPMIHCLGGVGRTGTLSAAIEIIQDPLKNIDDIVRQFRDSRNGRMIEDPSQREQLQQMKNFILKDFLLT